MKKIISIMFLMIIITNVLLAETRTETGKATSCIKIYDDEATLIFEGDSIRVQHKFVGLTLEELKKDWKISLKEARKKASNGNGEVIILEQKEEYKYYWLTADKIRYQLEGVKNKDDIIVIRKLNHYRLKAIGCYMD